MCCTPATTYNNNNETITQGNFVTCYYETIPQGNYVTCEYFNVIVFDYNGNYNTATVSGILTAATLSGERE